MTKEFLVLDALGGGPFAPKAKAGGLKGFSHMVDYFALGQSGNFTNLLKSNSVRPGSPNNPVGAIFRGLRFFDPGHRIAGLFGFHDS